MEIKIQFGSTNTVWKSRYILEWKHMENMKWNVGSQIQFDKKAKWVALKHFLISMLKVMGAIEI